MLIVIYEEMKNNKNKNKRKNKNIYIIQKSPQLPKYAGSSLLTDRLTFHSRFYLWSPKSLGPNFNASFMNP